MRKSEGKQGRAIKLSKEQRKWTKFAKGNHTFDSQFPRSHYREET